MLHTQMPQRIQRKRTKDWRKPDGAVSICRPGPLGNPFTIDAAIAAGLADTEDAARHLVVDAFHGWLPGGQEPDELPLVDGPDTWLRFHAALPRIVDHHIMCWCAVDQLCHGDILLPYARRLVIL